MFKVLFVCTGNICRSPTAEGVFRHMVEQAGLKDHIGADSAGTHSYHIGETPDHRSVAAARRRGVDLSRLRARLVKSTDFSDFDLVLALDRGHERILRQKCPPALQDRVRLLLDFAPNNRGHDVPDPYYGDASGFEEVLDLCEQACQGLLTHIQTRAGASP